MIRFSIDLAMSLSSVNPAFSLFWNRPELQRWCQGELLTFISILNACTKPSALCTARPAMVMLLFGLSELGPARTLE